MAEFLNLGDYCKVCKSLDFLPIACQHCKIFFCKNHFSPLNHNCESFKETDNILEKEELIKQKKLDCQFCKTKCTTLNILNCIFCKKYFCFEHRLQEEHNCENLLEKKNLPIPIKINIPKIKNDEVKIRGSKNEALALKVALMKLKAKAKGLNSIPIDERIYFNILNDVDSKIYDYYFCKRWSIGKIINYLSENLKIKNNNDKQDEKKLVLKLNIKQDDYFPFDNSLEELISKNVLLNGQKIVLCYQNN